MLFFNAIAIESFHPKVDDSNYGLGHCTFLSWDPAIKTRLEEETEEYTMTTIEEK